MAFTENKTATRSAKGLVSSGGHDVETVVQRIRMDTAGDESSYVSHVGHEENFVARFLDDCVTDFSNTSEIGDFHECGITD